MKKSTLNILVIEGCQGAGKTTLGAELMVAKKVLPVYPLINTLERPKQFEHKDNGAGLSLVTDLTWLLSAIQKYHYNETPIPFLIDRFFVSQWVYGQLRERTGGFPVTGLLKQSLSYSNRLIGLLSLEYFRRLNIKTRPHVIENINIIYLFLIPSVITLEERREYSGQTYAYSAIEEIQIYFKAEQVVGDMGFPVISLDGMESIDEVGELVDAKLLSLSS